jgi:hypothetical protein
MMRLASMILFLLPLAGCATRSRYAGTITNDNRYRHEITDPDDVVLVDGSTITLLSLGEVAFPDGIRALYIEYETGLPLEEDQVANQIPAVWWSFRPLMRREGYTHGYVVAVHRSDVTPSGWRASGIGFRGCLTDDGETLWLRGTGELTEEQRQRGQQCATGR